MIQTEFGRRVFVRGAVGVAAVGLAVVEVSAQPTGPGQPRPEDSKLKSTPIDLSRAPCFLDHCRLNGQVTERPGMLCAIWESGQIARCTSPTAPGKQVLVGETDPKNVTNLMAYLRKIGIHDAMMKAPQVVHDSRLDTLCIADGDAVHRVLWTRPVKLEYDDWALRFFATRDLGARLCAEAATLASNERSLAEYVTNFAHGRAWAR